MIGLNNNNNHENEDEHILGDITNQLRNVKINCPSSEEKKKNKKPVILENSRERFEGKLKFFDEQKNYGFIVMDKDESDAFVHFDDLRKANISKVNGLKYIRTSSEQLKVETPSDFHST